MKQETAVKIVSEDKKMTLICDSDVSLGALHDFLLEVKGDIVGRIQEAQKQEQEATAKVKEADAKKAEEAKSEVSDEVVVEEEVK